MVDIRYIDKDFVRFTFIGFSGAEEQATLVFGDKVNVLQEGSGSTPSRIRALELFDGSVEGTVKGKPFRSREKGVLKFSMVDVQQGDGMVETPPDENDQSKIILLDGGDNQLLSLVLYRGPIRASQELAHESVEVDLIMISHGDADHFDGLNDIKRSETEVHLEERKRLFIHPRRVYHNGIVKAPLSLPEEQQLGRAVIENGTPMIVDLFDDPRSAADKQNQFFKRWTATLTHWEQRGPIIFKRVAHGMNADDLFGFLGPKLQVEIQGPFTVLINDNGTTRQALPFLHEPPKSAILHLRDNTFPSSSPSVSHTINGHSIAFRLTYGHVRFNFTGDLNHESMALLRDRIPVEDFEAEIVKAPHHGSADFDFKALKAMRPVVSIISSGDESAAKEFIHPRATLVAALGKVSRDDTAIVLCTELAAFFDKRDLSHRLLLIAASRWRRCRHHHAKGSAHLLRVGASHWC